MLRLACRGQSIESWPFFLTFLDELNYPATSRDNFSNGGGIYALGSSGARARALNRLDRLFLDPVGTSHKKRRSTHGRLESMRA